MGTTLTHCQGTATRPETQDPGGGGSSYKVGIQTCFYFSVCLVNRPSKPQFPYLYRGRRRGSESSHSDRVLCSTHLNMKHKVSIQRLGFRDGGLGIKRKKKGNREGGSKTFELDPYQAIHTAGRA